MVSSGCELGHNLFDDRIPVAKSSITLVWHEVSSDQELVGDLDSGLHNGIVRLR